MPVTAPQQAVPELGAPTSSRSLLAPVLASFLVFAACSNASPAAAPTTTSDSLATSTSAAPPSTSTSPTSSTTATATATTTAPDPLEEDLLAAWNAFWAAWSAVRASKDLDPAPLQRVADPDVVEGVVALFERQRESGLGPVETDVVTSARVTDLGSDKATIEDCVLLSLSFTDTVGVWYQADLANGAQGWVVVSLFIPSGGGCVPEQMAEAAIAGYDAYYDARETFWDPPDPDHPLVDAVLSEPQQGFIVGLLEEHEARRVALRGRPETHAEVIEVRSPTELVVFSCMEADPDYGLYDLDTGERLTDEPSVREGQRDLESAVMVFEGGLWKVADLQGQVDFACEFAPTERGLPSV